MKTFIARIALPTLLVLGALGGTRALPAQADTTCIVNPAIYSPPTAFYFPTCTAAGALNVAVVSGGGGGGSTVFPYTMTSDAQAATTASAIGLAIWNGTTIDRLQGVGGALNVRFASTPTVSAAGSNGGPLAQDGSNRLVVVGAGTAGTPAGGVLTVQGAASGTALPVTGSFTLTLPFDSGAANQTSGAAKAVGIAGFDGTNVQPIAVSTGGAVKLSGANGNPINAATASDGLVITGSGLFVRGSAALWNGANFDRQYATNAITGTATGVEATGLCDPTAARCAAVDIGGVLKTELGNNACTSGTLTNVAISTASAATTQLVAASGATKIYVCKVALIAGGATNVTLEYGTGTLCATGLTAFTGPMPLAAQAGWVEPSGTAPNYTTPASQALCLVNSAAVQVSGSLLYVQQ